MGDGPSPLGSMGATGMVKALTADLGAAMAMAMEDAGRWMLVYWKAMMDVARSNVANRMPSGRRADWPGYYLFAGQSPNRAWAGMEIILGLIQLTVAPLLDLFILVLSQPIFLDSVWSFCRMSFTSR